MKVATYLYLWAVDITTDKQEFCWVFDDREHAKRIAQSWADGGAMVLMWRM
jgi:hypothetical protein